MVSEKTGCVVLADRHQNVLEGIRGLLEAVFETVMMVADKKSLFEAIEKVKPDLAVVDLSLTAAGEVSIAREINNSYPALRFIILSVHDEPTVVDEVMSAGASGFVLKRSVALDLFEAVRNVQEGRTFVSDSGRN
ncbi:MAG: response regulator transcription factor [Sedimentisphaerales bacterium]|jgi:DNA-binding NarL/FixJ family response regulator